MATTYADIVKRDNVRQATMATLGLGLLPEYSARTVPNTQLGEITVTDTDPVRAQAVAKELVNQLVAISPSGQNGESQKRQAFISGQLNELEDKIKATQSEITFAAVGHTLDTLMVTSPGSGEGKSMTIANLAAALAQAGAG